MSNNVESKKYKLASGRELEIQLAPFSDSKKVYKVIAKLLKDEELKSTDELDVNFFKSIGCSLLASDELEEVVLKCADKCIYNDERIGPDTFDSEIGRGDYLEALTFIAKENAYPFMKTLMQKYSQILEEVLS